MTSFSDLGLIDPLLKALSAENYTTPTPIQTQAIPQVLDGHDLLGIAQTGTGKTAAFALPILQRLIEKRQAPARRSCRTLVLSPTRELATQIADSFRAYARHLDLSIAVIFDGVSAGPQARRLAGGLDILVATPGRLLDHVRGGMLRLDQVEIFVLDEADQMLDMGFIHDIRKVIHALPPKHQTLFFSATMPKEIGNLAGDLLKNPVQVQVTPVAATADRVEQHMVFVDQERKRFLLADLLRNPDMKRILVFTRTKHGADRVSRHLTEAGIGAAAIHGNKSQGQRERALASFKSGETRALVATDIAARGIDVDAVTHVVNFDLPNVPESYVHRIGRTARAGAAGQAISFCAPDERGLLRDIERLIRQQVPVLEGHGAQRSPDEAAAAGRPRPRPADAPHGQRRRNNGRPAGNGNRGNPAGAPQQRTDRGDAAARPPNDKAGMADMPFMRSGAKPRGRSNDRTAG